MSKTILITGSTDGLGMEVARRLAVQGHKVLLHGRNKDKGNKALAEFKKVSGNTDLHYFNADLSTLSEVKRLTEEVISSQSRLDVLVNNAGIGPRTKESSRSLSGDGHELSFAVNYLAGYLLARQLLPLLKQSAPARIINVASIGQAPVNFADVMLENNYDDFLAYRQSKLAQILHANDLTAQLEGTGVTANSLHPATLMGTKMVADSSYLPDSMTSVDDGADALENLIVNEKLVDTSGVYFDGLNAAFADDHVYDSSAQIQLRELSESFIEKMVN